MGIHGYLDAKKMFLLKSDFGHSSNEIKAKTRKESKQSNKKIKYIIFNINNNWIITDERQ